MATGRHRELLALTAPTLVAYGRRHDWDVVVSCEPLYGERPPSWGKLVLLRELLRTYELVFWIDADAIIVDIERDVLSEIDPAHDVWLARHPQQRREDETVLNAGIILARRSPFTERLFDAMWNAEQFIDHNWWENAALLDLLGYSLDPPFGRVRETEWEERIGPLDLAWNSVPGYCESPTPAINHHARSDHDSFERRLGEMAADLAGARAKFPAAFGDVPTIEGGSSRRWRLPRLRRSPLRR